MIGTTTDLKSVLELYRGALAPAVRDGTLSEFSLTPIDHLGIPLWTVALVGNDGALSDGFGYGPDLLTAQVSAWGETLEWFCARENLKTRTRERGSFRGMVARGFPAIDPVTLCLEAGTSYDPAGTVLEWVEAKTYPAGESRWVPIEFVAPRYADLGGASAERMAVPITNGLGAGPNFAHALAQGVLELLQRDGNSVAYRAMDRGCSVDGATVRDAGNRRVLTHFAECGLEIFVKLAATDFGMANLYVVGHDREPGRAPHPVALSACGEAVGLDPERALGKALHEFASARARKTFNHGPLPLVRAVAPPGYLAAIGPDAFRNEDARAFEEMRAWVEMRPAEFLDSIRHPLFDVRERIAFADLPQPAGPPPNAQGRLDTLTARLAGAGLEVLYVEFSDARAGVSVLKAIVPGLEVETLTYGRIGARNLRRLLDRGETMVGIGAGPPGAKPIVLPEACREAFPTPWLDPTAVAARLGRLYPLYREPSRHAVRLLSHPSLTPTTA